MVDEFNQIQDCARQNRMIINLTKSTEIVFFINLNQVSGHLLLAFKINKKIHDAKPLGVILSDNLSFEKHVCSLLACCSQRTYRSKLQCEGGVSPNNLNTVFSLILNRILHCMYSCLGRFSHIDQIRRINVILKSARRNFLTGDTYDVVGLSDYQNMVTADFSNASRTDIKKSFSTSY